MGDSMVYDGEEIKEIDNSDKVDNKESALKDLENVWGIGTVVGAVTGKVPNSILDALGMDIVETLIGLVPGVGDIIVGGARTARYSFNKEIPNSIRGELIAVSLADTGVGIVPAIGDVIDLFLMTNVYSYMRIKQVRKEEIKIF